MARYLLVAHQTAQSDELVAAALDLKYEDPQARFTLLVPATPVASLMIWEEGETLEVARRHAGAARRRLEERGLHVEDARPADSDPVAAIEDELHMGQRFAAIVVSTLPPGLSRWLRMDVISRVRRSCPSQRVVHVAVAAAPAVDAARQHELTT